MNARIKTQISILVTSMLLGALVLFPSCGEVEEPPLTTGDQAFINLVASTWKVSAVVVDGVDRSDLFTNLTVRFTATVTPNGKPTDFSGTFTTTNGGPVWPASGTFTISDPASGTTLARSDGVTVQLSNVTATSLTMTVAWNKDTYGPGRIESVKGQHVFTMGK
jgi:hypothetical protein